MADVYVILGTSRVDAKNRVALGKIVTELGISKSDEIMFVKKPNGEIVLQKVEYRPPQSGGSSR